MNNQLYQYKINKLFPNNIHNNNLKLMFDYIGEFSITLPNDASVISNIILYHTHKNITITDCTAGIGGNTISFANTFNIVNAIEINSNRFNLLKNNINYYNLKINLINDNFLNFIFQSFQDVIYIDPPWGGKGYKKNNNIRLEICNIKLENCH